VICNPDARNVLVLLCLSALLWAPRLQGPIDLRYDAGVYYILGTSLAEGQGYRLLNEPGQPQAIQYPPLLPVLVALQERVLGTTDPAVVGPWLRRTYALLSVLYILAVYTLARQLLPPAYALLAALLTALYVHTYYLSNILFTEIPFALVTTLFVLCNRRGQGPGSFVLTSLLGVTAYLLRTAGVALLMAWVVESLLHKRWKQAAARAAVSLAPLLAWQAYIGHVQSEEEYQHPAYPYQRATYLYYNVTYAENILQWVDPFAPERGRASPGELGWRFARNLAAMPMALGEGVTATKAFWEAAARGVHKRLGVDLPPVWVAFIPPALVGGLVLIGVGVLLFRRELLIVLYLGASIVLIGLTPWPGQFTRYLAPLTPFLALALLQLAVSLRGYAARCSIALWARRGWAFLLLVVGGALSVETASALFIYTARHEKTHPPPGGQGVLAPRLFFYDRAWAAFDTALAWLKERAKPAEVVATSAPHGVYLHVGCKAVMPPFEADSDEAQRLLDSVPVTYAIVDDLQFIDISRRYVGPVIQKHPERWQRVYSSPDGKTRVYRRVKE
jgi:hypothetical protein